MQPIRKDKPKAEAAFTSLRISTKLHQEIMEIAEEMPAMSANALGVECIEAVLEMLKTPNRSLRLGKLMNVLEAARKPVTATDIFKGTRDK